MIAEDVKPVRPSSKLFSNDYCNRVTRLTNKLNKKNLTMSQQACDVSYKYCHAKVLDNLNISNSKL